MKKTDDSLASFRSRFWHYLLVLLLLALLGWAIGWGGISILLYVREGRIPSLDEFLISLLFLLLGAALVVFVSAVVVLCYKVHVHTWGLRSFDFWGSYHEIEWGEMKEVRAGNLLGLRYLRVISPGRATLWVPLFLVEPGRFLRVVREAAGPDHPLVVALEENTFAE